MTAMILVDSLGHHTSAFFSRILRVNIDEKSKMGKSMRQLRSVLKSTFLALTLGGVCCSVVAAETEEPQTRESSADTTSITLPEVVVTAAQKRVQPIKDVPIAMTVVSHEALENGHAATLTDMQQLVPNFSIDQSIVRVRGVGGGGTNIGFDTRVGIYLDGIYLGQTQALEQALLDADTVEVLRGPQGHLFGRNTVAGAVNITTRAPSETFESTLSVDAGSYSTREAHGSLSGPIADKLQGRFSFGYETRDGFTTNLFDPQMLDGLKRTSVRGQLAIQASDRLEIKISADHADIKQTAITGEAMTGMFDAPMSGGPYTSHTVNFNTKPFTNSTLSGASLTANYDMPGGSTLTAITGYRDTHQDWQHDLDWSPLDVGRVNYSDGFKQLSQEIRIASPAKDSLRYVAGMYLMRESANSFRASTSGNDAGLLGLPVGVVVPVSSAVKTDSYALFGAIDYDLTNKLTLNLGTRYTFEKKDLLYNLTGAGFLGIGNAVNYTDTRSDNMMTPTVGITYALDKSLNIYGKYSSGFKSGGWNLDFLSAAQIANKFNFNKESVKSYELGLKGSAFEQYMQYDLTVFHSSFKDYQVYQFVNTGLTTELQLRNAAKAASTGAEASFQAMATKNLSIGVSVGIVSAVFKSFPGGLTGGGDAAGKHLPYSPSMTTALSINYNMPAPSLGGRLALYGEYNHRSNSFSGVDNNDSTDRVSSRNVVNSRVSLTSNTAPLELSLWVRNLFNNSYTTASGRDFFGNQYIKRGDPRIFGFEGKYSF
ncbi:MAG: TonB-dependent receptor [Sideroxydans sp.]|nr:TonB-dependent receptor [Sideroxydans sp.]